MEIRGRSFAVLAEVTVDTAGAEGVLFKQGGAHGGHVLFVQDGRLHYVYNFLGEEEQTAVVPRRGAAGRARASAFAIDRTGTVENSHTPLGDVTLFIDDRRSARWRSAGASRHFGLAGAGITVGRNGGSAVSSRYKAPFAFTGGTIAQVDRRRLRRRNMRDLERELARAFAKD